MGVEKIAIEGIFPKVDGDIAFASEYNSMDDRLHQRTVEGTSINPGDTETDVVSITLAADDVDKHLQFHGRMAGNVDVAVSNEVTVRFKIGSTLLQTFSTDQTGTSELNWSYFCWRTGTLWRVLRIVKEVAGGIFVQSSSFTQDVSASFDVHITGQRTLGSGTVTAIADGLVVLHDN